MMFFGHRYEAPAYEDAEHVETPVGASCFHCGETIVAGDDGWMISVGGMGEPVHRPWHSACWLRGIVGSVAHQQRRCSCYVLGATCTDDPTLTRRQAAEAAEVYFLKHMALMGET